MILNLRVYEVILTFLKDNSYLLEEIVSENEYNTDVI
jgi:hypothetical protein